MIQSVIETAGRTVIICIDTSRNCWQNFLKRAHADCSKNCCRSLSRLRHRPRSTSLLYPTGSAAQQKFGCFATYGAMGSLTSLSYSRSNLFVDRRSPPTTPYHRLAQY